MITNNLFKKVDWAIIAAECLASNQETGYKRAMTMYKMYDARSDAGFSTSAFQSWNRAARSLKHSQISWALKDDITVQDSYRKMVRANSKGAQL